MVRCHQTITHMAQRKVTPTIIKLAKKYKRELQKVLPVEQVILFGSQVKGTAKSYSDIDICVVSPIFGKDRHDERVMLSQFVDNIDLRLEPHPLHPSDFQDKWDTLAQEVRRTGISV